MTNYFLETDDAFADLLGVYNNCEQCQWKRRILMKTANTLLKATVQEIAYSERQRQKDCSHKRRAKKALDPSRERKLSKLQSVKPK